MHRGLDLDEEMEEPQEPMAKKCEWAHVSALLRSVSEQCERAVCCAAQCEHAVCCAAQCEQTTLQIVYSHSAGCTV